MRPDPRGTKRNRTECRSAQPASGASGAAEPFDVTVPLDWMAAPYGIPARGQTASSVGHGGPLRTTLRSSRAARCPFGNWSSTSQRHAATMARTRPRHSLEQCPINVWVAHADLGGDMGQIELDRPSAASLEVDEQRPPVRAEQVARVRLTV